MNPLRRKGKKLQAQKEAEIVETYYVHGWNALTLYTYKVFPNKSEYFIRFLPISKPDVIFTAI